MNYNKSILLIGCHCCLLEWRPMVLLQTQTHYFSNVGCWGNWLIILWLYAIFPVFRSWNYNNLLLALWQFAFASISAFASSFPTASLQMISSRWIKLQRELLLGCGKQQRLLSGLRSFLVSEEGKRREWTGKSCIIQRRTWQWHCGWLQVIGIHAGVTV